MFQIRNKNNIKDHSNDDPDNKEDKVKYLRASLGPMSTRNLQFCTDSCLRRYLEARNWNLEKSKKMLEATLKWRSTYMPELIRWHEVATESETGKAYRADFLDRFGRTVLIFRPRLQNTKSHDNQVKQLVYLLENAILNLAEGREQMVWLIDFDGWSLSKATSMKTSRETANILQNHYPERLSLAFLYNPPKIFESFWKIIRHFLDPKTFLKVKFVYPNNKESRECLEQNFDMDLLPIEFGGNSTSKYNHEEFAKMMIKDDISSDAIWGLCDEPRKLDTKLPISETDVKAIKVASAS